MSCCRDIAVLVSDGVICRPKIQSERSIANAAAKAQAGTSSVAATEEGTAVEGGVEETAMESEPVQE